MTDLTKTCKKCKQAKPFDMFSRCARYKDGLAYSCKTCVAQYYKTNRKKILESKAKYRKANAEQIAEYSAEYRKANAEQIAKSRAEYCKANAEQKAAYDAKYRKANAEQIATYDTKYRKANAKRIAEYGAKYYKANVEKIAEYGVEYRKANQSIMNAHQAKRKATKLQATPSWLTKAHLKQIRLVYQEAKLLSDRGFVHHVDHIVPLQGKNVSGLHVPWNLRAIPASVNQSKFNATPDTLPTVRYF